MLDPKDGGPAFPVIGAPGAREDFPGMSLRDWFAGQALMGSLGHIGPHEGPENEARRAYRYADAMLAERSKAK